MARQGRFGRSETGASNLSDTIRSLIAQQAAQEEQMLFKSFFDQTEFGGRIPNYNDLVNFINEKLSSGSASDAQIAYYDNLLASAKETQNTMTYSSLMGEFKRTGGKNLKEVLSFLSEDGEAQFGDDVYNIVTNHISDSRNRLKDGIISVEEYNSISEDVLDATIDYPALYEDSKFNTMYGLYDYELLQQQQAVNSVKGKKLEKVINANKQLVAWKKTWAQKFYDAGFETSSVYTGLLSSISSDNTMIKTQEKQLQQNQIAAFISAKEQQYLSDKKPLDAIARQVALDLGISADDNFTLTDLNKKNPAAFNFWLNGQSQDTREKITGLVSDLESSANAYIRANAKNNVGYTEKTQDAMQTISSAKSSLGLDTTYNDYQMGLIQKVKLMTVADNVPASEKIIAEQWASFLGGKETELFGKGIVKSQDSETQQMLDNEISLTLSYLRGETIALTPKTLNDVMVPALVGLGLIAEPKIPDQFKELESKYTAAEMQNVLQFSKDAEDVAYGKKQVFRDPYVNSNGEVDFKTTIVPTGTQSPGLGTVVRVERDAFGNAYQAIYKGIPIYASKAGTPSTDSRSLWGYATTLSDGSIIYSSKAGEQYKTPPLDIRDISLSSQVVSGSEQPIYIAVGASVSFDKATGLPVVAEKNKDSAVKTDINDYVDQSVLDQSKNPSVYSGNRLKTPEWYKDEDIKKRFDQQNSISLGVADLLTGLAQVTDDSEFKGKLINTADEISKASSAKQGIISGGIRADMARIQQEANKQASLAPKLSQRTYPVYAGDTSYVSMNGQLPGANGFTINDAFRNVASIKPKATVPWSPVSSVAPTNQYAVPTAARYVSPTTSTRQTAPVQTSQTVSAMPFNPQDPEARRALIMGQQKKTPAISVPMIVAGKGGGGR